MKQSIQTGEKLSRLGRKELEYLIFRDYYAVVTASHSQFHILVSFAGSIVRLNLHASLPGKGRGGASLSTNISSLTDILTPITLLLSPINPRMKDRSKTPPRD